MNFSELSQSAREIADRIEQMNANIAWLKSDTNRYATAKLSNIDEADYISVGEYDFEPPGLHSGRRTYHWLESLE